MCSAANALFLIQHTRDPAAHTYAGVTATAIEQGRNNYMCAITSKNNVNVVKCWGNDRESKYGLTQIKYTPVDVGLGSGVCW